MGTVVAFDSKEFNIKGVFKDFFCPIGIGLTVRDVDAFQEAYCRAVEAAVARRGMTKRRRVFDSYTLARLLGGLDSAADFYEEIVRDLHGYLDHVHLFFTIIPPAKVPAVLVYDTQPEAKNPVDFLKEHRAGYVALCAWKYSQIVPNEARADRAYLDFFEAKRTKAWDSLTTMHPVLFIRGDTCNPCLAMADGLLSVLDRQMKRNYYIEDMKLSDKSVGHALRYLSLRGEPVFIGQPDLRKIVPYSRDQVVTSSLVRRPVFFICPEKRPDGLDNAEYREMLGFMPIMNLIVDEALKAGGCIKFYDATQDFLLVQPNDRFAFFGERGRGMCEALQKHLPIIPLDLAGLEKE